MSFQQTNLVTDPEWVGPRELPPRARATPGSGRRSATRPSSRCWRCCSGTRSRWCWPCCMSELRRAKGLLQRARLPARWSSRRWWRCCCGGSSTTPARPACSTPSSAGSGSARTRGSRTRTWAMPSLVLQATWANAGATVIIYLAALDRRPRRAVRRGRGRRRRPVAQDLARDAAADAQRPAHHADPAGHRHVPGVHRAVPDDQRRPAERDDDDPAADLRLRLPASATTARRRRCRVLLALFLAVLSAVYFRVTRSWSTT